MPSSKTQFKKGNKAGTGRPKMTTEVKEIRRMNREALTKILDKYSEYSINQLKKVKADKSNTPAIEMIVVINLLLSLEKANANSRDFIIERMAGKVVEQIKVEGTMGHKSIIEQLKD